MFHFEIRKYRYKYCCWQKGVWHSLHRNDGKALIYAQSYLDYCEQARMPFYIIKEQYFFKDNNSTWKKIRYFNHLKNKTIDII